MFVFRIFCDFFNILEMLGFINDRAARKSIIEQRKNIVVGLCGVEGWPAYQDWMGKEFYEVNIFPWITGYSAAPAPAPAPAEE